MEEGIKRGWKENRDGGRNKGRVEGIKGWRKE